MRFCIAGKNDIAVSALEYLLEVKQVPLNKLCIICNKTETGQNGWQRSLRFYAAQKGVKEESLEMQYNKQDLVFLSLEFDRIIKPACFKSQRLYNIHFSKLPQYKGMYTSALPILNGEEESGVTFHKIDWGIDTGDIIFQKTFKLDKNETARTLYFKYISVGTEIIKKVIDYLCAGFSLPSAIGQNPSDATYYSKKAIDYDNLEIDLNKTAQEIDAQIRAVHFREYQLPIVYQKKINSTHITDCRSFRKPGTILWEDESRMVLASIDYNIVLYIDCFMEILRLCEQGNLEQLKRIPRLSTYMHQKDAHGWTPLMIATYYNHYDIVQFLLSEGSNLYDKNRNGTTLLMYAKDAYLKTGDDHLFAFFYHSGLSVCEKDYSGKNLIDYCREQGIRSIGSIEIEY